MHQVSPSLSFIVASEGGSLEFIYDAIHSGLKRLSASQIDMITNRMESSV